MKPLSQEAQRHLEQPPHFRSFERTPIITNLNPESVVNTAANAFSTLKALRADQVRTPLEKASIAKKMIAELEKASNTVAEKAVKMTFEVEKYNAAKSDFLVNGIESNFAANIVNAYKGAENKGVAERDPVVMNALNKMPLFMSGLTQERLDSLNDLHIKQHSPELTRRQDELGSTSRAINYADSVIKAALEVANQVAAPANNAAKIQDNGFL
ncbi:hypothetical protein [Vibrio sp.]|uniref:hypothetical protein n=1 Tax=Vibrio sp. TaxID=678 RepID=UPI003AA91C06